MLRSIATSFPLTSKDQPFQSYLQWLWTVLGRVLYRRGLGGETQSVIEVILYLNFNHNDEEKKKRNNFYFGGKGRSCPLNIKQMDLENEIASFFFGNCMGAWDLSRYISPLSSSFSLVSFSHPHPSASHKNNQSILPHSKSPKKLKKKNAKLTPILHPDITLYN